MKLDVCKSTGTCFSCFGAFWGMPFGTYTLATSLKKTDAPLSISYKLPIVPQVGVELFYQSFPYI